MKQLLLPLSMVLILSLFQACDAADTGKRLDRIEARQDSILALLKGMQEKHAFMAERMGWRPPPDTTPKEIPLGGSPATGAKNPILTIVEFTDLQCPYCARVAPVLDSIANTYPKDVRVVFKHFPLSFHQQAREAAAAVMAAGKQGKFFEYRYRIAPEFAKLGDSTYLAIAEELGLNTKKFREDMKLTDEQEKIIDRDMELGRKLGVEGTPTIFVNGRLAQNRSYEYFEQLIKKIKEG